MNSFQVTVSSYRTDITSPVYDRGSRSEKRRLEVTKQKIAHQHIERLFNNRNCLTQSVQRPRLPSLVSSQPANDQQHKVKTFSWNLQQPLLLSRPKDECDQFSGQVIDQLKLGKVKYQINESVFVENQILNMHQDMISVPQRSKDNNDLSQMLDQVNSDIKMALYKISRCVDDGDHHKALSPSEPLEIQVTAAIPQSLKVSLDGSMCPLLLSLQATNHKASITVYASFKNSEPTEAAHDFKFLNENKIQISELNRKKQAVPRTPSEKFRIKFQSATTVWEFKSETLYISLISDLTTTIRCQAKFPNSPKIKLSIQTTEVPSTQRRNNCKILQNIKEALDQPYIASEMIIRMQEVQELRKKQSKQSPKRNVVQEHKDLLSRWHETLEKKQQIMAITMPRKIEVAKQKKEEKIQIKKDRTEQQMTKWDDFRVRKQQAVFNYIKAKQGFNSLCSFQKIIQLYSCVKQVYATLQKAKADKTRESVRYWCAIKIVKCMRKRLYQSCGSYKLESILKRTQLRTQQSLRGITHCIISQCEQLAAQKHLIPFLMSLRKPMEMKSKIVETAKHLQFIKHRFVYQIEKQHGKAHYLEKLWTEELQNLILEIAKTKTSKEKQKLKQLQNINIQFQKELIKKYLERCKFKYVLAFMQWRAMQYNSNYSENEAIFKARHQILMDSIKTNKNRKMREALVNDNMITCETPTKTQEDSEDERGEVKGKQRDLQLEALGINKKDLVMSFEELGWFDPDSEQKVAVAKVLSWLKSLSFNKHIYPPHQMQEDSTPNTIFVPSKEMLRKMIRTVARCKTVHDMRDAFNCY